MNDDKFVNLHVHTDGSLLDGLTMTAEGVKRVVDLGQKHIGISDHGNLHNVYELYKEVQKYKAEGVDLNAVIGVEAYVAPSHVTRHHHAPAFFADGGPDDVSARGSYTHMLLFAKNNQGLKDLFKLNYLSYKEGNYKKNRIDIDLLREHATHLIGTTGCPSGEIQTKLRLGMREEALEHARMMQEIFGKDDYYMELMDHDMSIDLERKVEADLLWIAEELDIPLLATADSHYTHPEQSFVHENMLCISTYSMMSVPKTVEEGEGGKTRFAFDGTGYHLNSYDEMIAKFPEDKYPNAVTNTVRLAEKCDVTISYKDGLRPSVPLPDGMTEEEYLRSQAWEGFHRRLPESDAATDKYLDQLKYELDIIISKGYSGYFLVVSDFLRWAKRSGIRVGPGRGSAAGSLLAYCLDITDAEPLRHGLIFARFINPERDSPPDIDIDFDDTRRGEVVKYVEEMYGAEYVSHVMTYGRIKAKNAVKDVLRIYEHPFATGEALTKSMPEAIFGKGMPLKDMYTPGAPRYEEAEEFRQLVKEFGVEKEIEISLGIENRTRSIGTHACAIIISKTPIVETVPMMVQTKKQGKVTQSTFQTQWDYPACEDLGLLKMDFLGLRNLSILEHAVQLVKKRHDVDLNLTALAEGAMDDRETYKLLQSGNTLGVFQLDGDKMRDLLRLMKPTSFDDISAVLALYRPGPMGVNAHTDYALRKNGAQTAAPIHPELAEVLDPILSETHQLIVYQEQIMKIAQEVAGYSLGQADLLRRAMGKKKKSEMDAQWERFSEGGMERGYSKEALEALWNTIVPFADYAFNKAHSVAYGMISYMTAYMKVHYRVEYMAALLTSVSDEKDKTSVYLDDARQLGVKILTPDVSTSYADYTPISTDGKDDQVIRFGLKAIRGVGEQIANTISDEHEKNGPFQNFNELLNRLPTKSVNRKVFEALAYGGALDSLNVTRKSVIDSLDHVFAEYQKRSRSKKKSEEKKEQMGGDLFDMFAALGDAIKEEFESVEKDSIPEYKLYPSAEFSNLEKLKLEREYLGMYVSGHPLDGLNFASVPEQLTPAQACISERVPVVVGFPKRGKEPIISLGGMVSQYAMRMSKAGKAWASGKLEDRSGVIEFVIFGRTVQEIGKLLRNEEMFVLTGYPQRREPGGPVSFVVTGARSLEFGRTGVLPVRFKMTVDQWFAGERELLLNLQNFEAVGAEADKGAEVIISIRQLDGSVTEEVIPFKVVPSTLLTQTVRKLFGTSAIGRWRPRIVPEVSEE